MSPEQAAALKKGDIVWSSAAGAPPTREWVVGAGPKVIKLAFSEHSAYGHNEDRNSLAAYHFTEEEAFKRHLALLTTQRDRMREGLARTEKQLARSEAHANAGLPKCVCGDEIGYHNPYELKDGTIAEACHISRCECKEWRPAVTA